MNFLIRVDASFEIGIGHLMRCIALGQILQDDNHDVYFLTKTTNKYLLERLRKDNFKVKKLIKDINIYEDAKKTTKYAKKISADWVVTDGYKFQTDYQNIIKESGFKLMCIDDIAECHYVSDIVLNQNLNAENVFHYSCESWTKLLLGIKYVLLRREFRNLNGWKREIKKECKNILITMGGGEIYNYSLKIISALEKINDKKLNIIVILGPQTKLNKYLEELCKRSKHDIKILRNVNNIIRYMKRCNLAITASGSIIWEYLKLKTPLILSLIADNQKIIINEISSKSFAESLGDLRVTGESKIVKTIKYFFENKYKNIKIDSFCEFEIIGKNTLGIF